MSYKDDARAAGAAKMRRMGVSSSMDHRGPRRNDIAPFEKPSVAGSGRLPDKPVDIQGEKGKMRLDRAYARGGKVKSGGKTNVNIIVAPQGGGSGAPGPMPIPMGGPPAMPPRPVPPMPAGGPPMAGAALPGGAGMPPPGAMPMRKHGGRIPTVPMDAGSGSGLGRLEKAESYGPKLKKR